MSYLSVSYTRYHASEAKARGKDRVVIAGLVNKNFWAVEKLTDRPLKRDEAHGSRERALVAH